jgi:hypothetical protein
VAAAAGDRLDITWAPLPQADAYRVEIVTVAGRIVWQTQTQDALVHLGRAELPAGGDPEQVLLVRVLATGPDGFRRESALRELPVTAAGVKAP